MVFHMSALLFLPMDSYGSLLVVFFLFRKGHGLTNTNAYNQVIDTDT